MTPTERSAMGDEERARHDLRHARGGEYGVARPESARRLADRKPHSLLDAAFTAIEDAVTAGRYAAIVTYDDAGDRHEASSSLKLRGFGVVVGYGDSKAIRVSW